MAKVVEVMEADGKTHHGWMIRCPNEDCIAHEFDKRWTFNGDMERPTFRNSMLARWNHGPAREPRVCHSFVTDGRIEFLADCTHALAGKTVDLPDFEDRDW